MRIVPSWGGSMFEDLMVTLFVPEELWAPRSWGVNHPLYVRAQIEFGLEEAGYGYWGFSPACNPDGGYRTYGVDALGSDPLGYGSNNDNKTRTKTAPSTPQARLTNGIVTPYASFLALRFAPREAMENLRKLKEKFAIYNDHGFMDSVNVSTGVVADRVLILDQGMILAAIANALADDAMRSAFIDQESERILRPLIAPEEFTAGQASPSAHSARGDVQSRDNPPEIVVRIPSSRPRSNDEGERAKALLRGRSVSRGCSCWHADPASRSRRRRSSALMPARPRGHSRISGSRRSARAARTSRCGKAGARTCKRRRRSPISATFASTISSTTRTASTAKEPTGSQL